MTLWCVALAGSSSKRFARCRALKPLLMREMVRPMSIPELRVNRYEKIAIVCAGGFARGVAWLISDINRVTHELEVLECLCDFS
jgi:hypothetical protein